MKIFSSQNNPGVSAENRVVAKPRVNGDHTKQTQNVSILLVWCNPSVREPRHVLRDFLYISQDVSRDLVYLLMDACVKSRDTSTPCLHATWEATADI